MHYWNIFGLFSSVTFDSWSSVRVLHKEKCICCQISLHCIFSEGRNVCAMPNSEMLGVVEDMARRLLTEEEVTAVMTACQRVGVFWEALKQSKYAYPQMFSHEYDIETIGSKYPRYIFVWWLQLHSTPSETLHVLHTVAVSYLHQNELKIDK